MTKKESEQKRDKKTGEQKQGSTWDDYLGLVAVRVGRLLRVPNVDTRFGPVVPDRKKVLIKSVPVLIYRLAAIVLDK